MTDKTTAMEAAWALAEKIRTDLDRKSCPDAFMRIAVESIIANYQALSTYAAHGGEQKPISSAELLRRASTPEVINAVRLPGEDRFGPDTWSKPLAVHSPAPLRTTDKGSTEHKPDSGQQPVHNHIADAGKMVEPALRTALERAKHWFERFGYNVHGVAVKDDFEDHEEILNEIRAALSVSDAKGET